MAADVETMARRWINEGLNQGNVAVVDELFASSFINHSVPEQAPGPEGVKDGVRLMRAAFPDLQITVNDLIATADGAAWIYTARGTHGGDFAGIAATGNPVSYSGAVMVRVADGKFTEGRGVADTAVLLSQIGVAAQD
jgi:predicted ester cyclase